MNKKTVRDIDVNGKKVLVRVDFNVPLSSKDPNDDITVTDDTRIRAALPTLNYLLDNGAALILCSHLGRPSSAADTQFSMAPVAAHLETVLGRPVQMADDVVGENVTTVAAALKSGDVLVLENTRFHPGEKKNDATLSQQLADLADLYVDDAFGSAHRAHSSTEGVAKAIQAKNGVAVAGFLMEKELSALGTAVTNPPHPYIAIMGGAKISDKIKLIENLLHTADKILIGGGMANTFVRAQGHETGTSLVEEDALLEAERLLKMAGKRLVLPVDFVVTDKFDAEAEAETVAADSIPSNKMALDIGPGSLAAFKKALQGAQMVVWNGPMGVFEFARFAVGTNELAQLLAAQVEAGTEVIIGGGDSAAAVTKAGLAEKMSHISTGGGASLELLEGKTLPGIAALDDK
ncbi:MAG: phosphoglycerate kinase [Anaerolineales bacterium]|nr:phosphoglycerate kinase [Anaerolineales bacterium]MCB8938965.1 phosphoglycerate kinase [Ardenticatenaceae bacterium]